MTQANVRSSLARCWQRGLALALTVSLALTPSLAAAQSNALPSIGGAGGGLLSAQQEDDIGQQVLMSIRRSVPEIGDPLVYDYLDSITHKLVPSVPLQDRHLTLTVIDSPEINAFAVPGGIVGVNGGLFLHAETEQEFASVLAHELAHLSQRHFARRMEQQERSTPLTIAGMLAGIVLSAVTQSDLGIAAIAGTQALSVQNMLAYSRANEQEADRVGMDILASSGMDPEGMPNMFENMLRESRLQGNKVPEYLSTHPLTQNRVADSRNRADQYPPRSVEDSWEYHLMRRWMQVHYAPTPEMAVKRFEAETASGEPDPYHARPYGLAVAYLENHQPDKAETQLRAMLADHPGRITLEVTLARALIDQKKLDQAQALLKEALYRNPGNYPITFTLANAEMADNDGEAAAELLKSLTRTMPEQAYLWLKLADAEGMARNIVGVHRARGEYQALMGDLEAAERQLRQAQEKLPQGSPQRQAVTERLAELARQRHLQQQS
ncbi:M48 family metalloprotease [Marinobacter sp. C2H3]|uniref:M48 family metalloprotease n=1 Tax=Marinobacter sp. C2H3 TaxID=3119003 RepID=UPI00300F19B6